MSGQVDITEEQRALILDLLDKHLPNTAAWVYRLSREGRSAPPNRSGYGGFCGFFAKPPGIRSQGSVRGEQPAVSPWNVFVWHSMPEHFRRRIETDHVVLVAGRARFRRGLRSPPSPVEVGRAAKLQSARLTPVAVRSARPRFHLLAHAPVRGHKPSEGVSRSRSWSRRPWRGESPSRTTPARAVHQVREGLAADAQNFGAFGHAQAQRLQTGDAHDLAGCGGFFMGMGVLLYSVIVDEFNVVRILTLEAEYDAPVMGHAHRLRRCGDIELGQNRLHPFQQVGMDAAGSPRWYKRLRPRCRKLFIICAM